MRLPTNEERRAYHIHNAEAQIGRRVLSLSESGRDELVVVRDTWGWYVEVLNGEGEISAAWVTMFGPRVTRETDVLSVLEVCTTIEDLSASLLRVGFERRAL